MKALIGRKVGMSQLFSKDGEVIPVTLIYCDPNIVTLRRDKEKDGHAAVQLGLPRDEKKQKPSTPATAKATAGRQNTNNSQNSNDKRKLTPGQLNKQFEARREFSLELDDKVEQVGVEQFEVGDAIQVIGTSKGKGFQGVVKRHGFKGGPASHGHRHVLRSGGSIGSAYPQHVMKGKRMAGRMGADRVTVKNLSVMWIDKEQNVLAVKGAVPGTRGSIVEIISLDHD